MKYMHLYTKKNPKKKSQTSKIQFLKIRRSFHNNILKNGIRCFPGFFFSYFRSLLRTDMPGMRLFAGKTRTAMGRLMVKS